MNIEDVDVDELLSQTLHAPFCQDQPHKLFGCLPLVTRQDWDDENSDSSLSDDSSEYSYLDLNQYITPIIELSRECKLNENGIMDQYDNSDVMQYLLTGDGVGIAYNEKAKWTLVHDCGDGAGFYHLTNSFSGCFAYGMCDALVCISSISINHFTHRKSNLRNQSSIPTADLLVIIEV